MQELRVYIRKKCKVEEYLINKKLDKKLSAVEVIYFFVSSFQVCVFSLAFQH